MASLPTIRPEQVAPNSPFRLGKLPFVLAGADSQGRLYVYSQHRSEQAANDRRYRDHRYSQRVQVYRVVRD